MWLFAFFKKKTMHIFIYNSKIGVVLFNNENIFFDFGSRMGKNPAVYHENKEFDP